MKNLLTGLMKAYAAVAAYAVALAAVIVAILFSSGALTSERVTEAVAVLRAPKEKPPEQRGPGMTDEERREQEKTQRQRQETLKLREEDLQKLESRVTGQLSQVRRDREDLESGRALLLVEQEQLRKDREALATARTDAEIAANLPILSKLDGSGIVTVMRHWDDPRFIRYMRAMKPSKAAEVFETLRTDPQYEIEFRRVAEDAPPGTKTRAERLIEEFKRVP